MDFWMFDTPIGYMALGAENGSLIRVYLPNAPTPRLMPRKTPLLERAEQQLQEYFRGDRKMFDLPLAPEGTDFQKRVWTALQTIPYGETRTYKQLASMANCPQGYRAVGMANNRNPLPILIPCHRVIGADGSMTGYTGGMELKRALLELEKKFR